MTILTWFSKICGADVAPPKSPVPSSSPNKLITQDGPLDEPCKDAKNVVRETSRSIDCSSLVTPGQPDLDKAATTLGNQSGNNVLVMHKESNAATKETPVCQPSDDLVQVFGLDVLHQLQSKVWDDRARAVQGVREMVEHSDLGGSSPDQFFAASTSVVNFVLSDRVMPVYLGALDLARLLVVEFAPKYELLQELVVQHAATILPSIVGKTSDRNTRSIEATHKALIAIARALGCRFVMTHALTPISNIKETVAIRGRLELLELMLEEFGISKSSGVSLSAVMGWVRPFLEASDEKVRHAAVEVTVSCYSHKGERTGQYVSNLKPALQKLLEARFAEVDRCGGTKRGKSKAKRNKKRGGVALPALKGQQGQRSTLTKSRGSNRSSSSTSSGLRDSNSAASSDSNQLLESLREGPKPLDTLDTSFRSTGAPERLPSSMRLDSLAMTGGDDDLLSPVQYEHNLDKADACGGSGDVSNFKDFFDIDNVDEAFMDEIEGLL